MFTNAYMNDATRAATMPLTTISEISRGRSRNDTTWKTRVAMTTAMTETPAKAAMKTGRMATFRMPSTSAAPRATRRGREPDSSETPGVRKTAPRNESALTISVATMRRRREPLLGRHVAHDLDLKPVEVDQAPHLPSIRTANATAVGPGHRRRRSLHSAAIARFTERDDTRRRS